MFYILDKGIDYRGSSEAFYFDSGDKSSIRIKDLMPSWLESAINYQTVKCILSLHLL